MLLSLLEGSLPIRHAKVAGEVLDGANAVPWKKLQKYSAFVPQENVLDRNATVGEILYFAALCQRPTASRAEVRTVVWI